jgi:coenzyme Q-binding protein COQ10
MSEPAMSLHSESRIVPVSPEVVFDLVADVERYPDFLPLWQEARIIGRSDDSYETEQRVGLGFIQERFRTRTALHRPSHIRIVSDDPLFERFRINWDFGRVKEGGARITIQLDWAVHSWHLQKGIDLALPGVARMMVNAFETRARQAHLRRRRTDRRPSAAG